VTSKSPILISLNVVLLAALTAAGPIGRAATATTNLLRLG